MGGDVAQADAEIVMNADGFVAVDVTCEEAMSELFLPALHYVIVVYSAPPRVEVDLELSGAVNDDVAPHPNAQLRGRMLTISHPTPKIKIGGVHCWQNPSAALAVSGSLGRTGALGVAVEAPGVQRWNPTHQVNNLPPSAAAQLFGLGGRISSAPVSDCEDAEGKCDGDIVFGGGAKTGGSTYVSHFEELEFKREAERESLMVHFSAE